jgi:hypothetical protein
MGIAFFRRISRMGVSWSWPEMPPGTWVFEAHFPVVFEELRQPLLLEVIPNVTVSRNQTRGENRAWREVNAKGDLGVSVKYGLTSTITLDGTINPDFSQVESDAFQVEINERFPVFFSEKRPFFMEGLGLFDPATARFSKRRPAPGTWPRYERSSSRRPTWRDSDGRRRSGFKPDTTIDKTARAPST